MDEEDDYKPKPRRWGSPAYIVLVIIAMLIAVFVLWPIAHQVGGVFQRLTDAFKYGR